MSKSPQRWEWAIGLNLELLDEKHLQEAYKLNWDNLCKFDNCRKNCKRILCLACFDKTWIDNDSANSTYDSFETSNCEQKRADLKSFVGLKNLGATCYVNCLLQLWFHNPALRKAIYEWDNIADITSNSSSNNNTNSNNDSGNNNNNSSDRRRIENTSDHPKRIMSLESDSRDVSFNTPSKRPRISNDEISTIKTSMNSNSQNCTTVALINNHQNSTATNVAETTEASSIDNYRQASTTDFIQNNPIEQLQLIFARLQFTNKKSIDPFNFIESLALNATEQQDAQEFGNLFIEMLERSFAQQKNKFVSNIIKSQFLGRYSYATICDHCRHESVSDSNFYELDLSIQNLDTLHECLEEYFRPVPLDGKYNCSRCQRAQSAHRRIILKSVPPTLNLQLLRFVYDKQRNTRQKLNSFITFPEILDMTSYLNEANRKVKPNPFDLSNSNGGVRDRSNLYILSAVLIHRGSSPHSGHYIAHIKDRVTKDWFKFNDDSVERIGPQLQVSTDGENITIVDNATNYVKFNDPASGKVIKLESKSLKSKTAYMLVYQAHDNEALTYPSDHSEKWILPDHLQCAVAEENSKSDELFESLQIAREVDQQVMDVRRAQIRMIYDKLVCRDPSDRFEFIDKNWLQNWITNSSTTAKFSPIDNSHLLCIHDKLDFRKLDQVKCVRTEGADLLYKEFGGGGPRLQDAMCKKCVILEVKLIQLKERMKEDQKFITSQAKFKLEHDYSFSDAYVVGKNSYRDWQSLVMVQFKKSNPELANRGRGHGTSHSSDEEENKIEMIKDKANLEEKKDKEQTEEHESDNDDDDIEKFVFNSDILCMHGNLLNDTTAWRIVPKEVWMIFRRYFGDDPERPLLELDANHLMCAECRRQEAEQQEIGDIQKQIAVQQKSKLPDLFHNRKRASWNTMVPGDEYYALERQFLLKWQKFLKNPSNQEQPSSVNNGEKLVCKHKLTLYNSSNSNPLLPECPFALLSFQELTNLKEFYSVDYVIKYSIDPKLADERLKVYKASLKTTPKKSNSILQEGQSQNITRPLERCDSGDQHNQAAQARASQESFASGGSGGVGMSGEHGHLNATSSSSTTQLQPTIPQAQEQAVASKPDAEIDPTDIDWSECVVSDPRYCSECHELLKQDELKKLLNYDSATIYITKFDNRTARRNRSRDQAYTIRSNQTLLELKKEIYSRWQVLPIDQRLFLEEVLLDDSSKTMSELRIVPNCFLKLEIDRPISDTIDLIEDESTSRKSCAQPETGFKGSLLLSNNHF